MSVWARLSADLIGAAATGLFGAAAAVAVRGLWRECRRALKVWRTPPAPLMMEGELE